MRERRKNKVMQVCWHNLMLISDTQERMFIKEMNNPLTNV